MKFAIVFVFVLALAPMGHAATGNDLISQCTAAVHIADAPARRDGAMDATTGEAFQAGYCGGMVEGILSSLAMAHTFGTAHDNITKDVTVMQGTRIVQYLQTHPEMLAFPAPALVVAAFVEAFPKNK